MDNPPWSFAVMDDNSLIESDCSLSSCASPKESIMSSSGKEERIASTSSMGTATSTCFITAFVAGAADATLVLAVVWFTTGDDPSELLDVDEADDEVITVGVSSVAAGEGFFWT